MIAQIIGWMVILWGCFLLGIGWICTDREAVMDSTLTFVLGVLMLIYSKL